MGGSSVDRKCCGSSPFAGFHLPRPGFYPSSRKAANSEGLWLLGVREMDRWVVDEDTVVAKGEVEL